MPFLHTKPLGWATFGARIFQGEEELTQLKITAFKARGSFILDGEEFTVEPKGFFLTSADLKKGSSVIARVEKESAFRRRFEISSAGHRFTLASERWTGRDYVLLMGKQEVGRVRREGFAGRKLKLEFPEDVPLFIQVLLAYIVLAQAKREAAAAASGA